MNAAKKINIWSTCAWHLHVHVHPADGSSLPLDEQLRCLPQLQVLCTLQNILVGWLSILCELSFNTSSSYNSCIYSKTCLCTLAEGHVLNAVRLHCKIKRPRTTLCAIAALLQLCPLYHSWRKFVHRGLCQRPRAIDVDILCAGVNRSKCAVHEAVPDYAPVDTAATLSQLRAVHLLLYALSVLCAVSFMRILYVPTC